MPAKPECSRKRISAKRQRVTAWHSVDGDIAQLLAERARFADLLLLGQSDTENPPTLAAFSLPQKVVVDAGTPILMVLTRGAFDDIGRHVHPTANAAAAAAHLARHGVTTEPTEILSGEKNVTDVLLAHVTNLGADLLVMGAYGHPRLLEFVLGGTTQSILERAAVPILVSHY
jgi:nucleotide-binding universal stress UspA family protein